MKFQHAGGSEGAYEPTCRRSANSQKQHLLSWAAAPHRSALFRLHHFRMKLFSFTSAYVSVPDS